MSGVEETTGGERLAEAEASDRRLDSSLPFPSSASAWQRCPCPCPPSRLRPTTASHNGNTASHRPMLTGRSVPHGRRSWANPPLALMHCTRAQGKAQGTYHAHGFSFTVQPQPSTAPRSQCLPQSYAGRASVRPVQEWSPNLTWTPGLVDPRFPGLTAVGCLVGLLAWSSPRPVPPSPRPPGPLLPPQLK